MRRAAFSFRRFNLIFLALIVCFTFLPPRRLLHLHHRTYHEAVARDVLLFSPQGLLE